MQIQDTKQFRKELAKLPKTVQINALESIESVMDANSFADIPNLKKMVGHPNFYRIKINQYRIGLFWDGTSFILEAIGVRGDFYKQFP